MAKPAPNRGAMIAKCHIAKAQLALTDDSYRDLLRRITGLESTKEMRTDQLDAVLREFARLGWKPKPAFKRSPNPQIRMIYAVWKDIATLKGGGTKAELRAFVRRQTKTPLHPDGIAAPEFLDGEAGNSVLEGLKGWRARLRGKAA
ncbi:regulatory protein GemA [Roseomonas sp. HJA6]|uniref:Regulatory protein GemA n=1 Tax=Roseomonas alba TaxID=2846776 RepID=A0ABS7AIA6_9PROT|nr:regulatory protein GemA [Neoroseomonas alba]MBW6402058.1 regulatory protein GemA [Neoroseomonas alba]